MTLKQGRSPVAGKGAKLAVQPGRGCGPNSPLAPARRSTGDQLTGVAADLATWPALLTGDCDGSARSDGGGAKVPKTLCHCGVRKNCRRQQRVCQFVQPHEAIGWLRHASQA